MAKRGPTDERDQGGTFGLLWGTAPKPSRGPKASVSVEETIKAGIEIADGEGLAALTMKSVAQQLGVTTMALYRYVPSKDALIDLMADAVMKHAPRQAGGNWRAEISAWARANLRLIQRHCWLIDLIGTRVSIGPNWTRWLDRGLGALRDLPLSVSEKMAVLLLVDGHIRSAAQIVVGAKASKEWADNFGHMLEIVDGDARYPTLGAMVATGGFAEPGLDLDSMFEFGLERLLDGVEAFANRR